MLSCLHQRAGVTWTEVCSEAKDGMERLTEQHKTAEQLLGKKNTAVTASVPGLTPLRCHPAHPRLVNIHWIGFDIKQFDLSSFPHNWCQDLLQGILTMGTTAEPF